MSLLPAQDGELVLRRFIVPAVAKSADLDLGTTWANMPLPRHKRKAAFVVPDRLDRQWISETGRQFLQELLKTSAFLFYILIHGL
jgi:hypothetical protein